MSASKSGLPLAVRVAELLHPNASVEVEGRKGEPCAELVTVPGGCADVQLPVSPETGFLHDGTRSHQERAASPFARARTFLAIRGESAKAIRGSSEKSTTMKSEDPRLSVHDAVAFSARVPGCRPTSNRSLRGHERKLFSCRRLLSLEVSLATFGINQS